MKFYGSIAYWWRGSIVHAVASPANGSFGVPDATVSLLHDRVLVGRPIGGTAHVPWEAVHDIRGWSAPSSEASR